MFRLQLLFVLGLLCLAVAVRGEPAAGDAEVSGLRFRLVRPANGAAEAWAEAELEVTARPAPDNAAGLVPRVRVTLTLATETGGAAKGRRIEFYRATAEAVALRGGSNRVRFYLPPEIVASAAVRSEPRFWSAVVSTAARAGGEPQVRFSSALATAEQRTNFSNQSAAATANDGVLLPQYLTPFASEYPNATPTFVRRESGG